MKRSYIFWGVVLISFGSIFILDGKKLLPGNPLEYLWQVFLILMGTWIIINSRRKNRDEKKENYSIALQGASRAKVHINHGAGQLDICSGAKKGDLLSYSSMGTIQRDTNLYDDLIDIRLSPISDIIPLVGLGEGFNWELRFSNEVPLSLFLDTGASKTYANLSDLNITNLRVSTGASTCTIILPSIPKRSDVSISAGAASLNIQVPINVSARIRVRDGLTSLNIDKDRFKRINASTYQSQDFNIGSHQTEILIEAGVGSISIH